MTTEEYEQAQKLAKVIEAHRGRCTAQIDNDSWHIYKDQPGDFEDWDEDKQDDWYEGEGTIAKSGDYPLLGICYGAGILEALALQAGLRGENV